MKAFFDISLPTDWNQLTDRQLTFLFGQLAMRRPAFDVETRCLIKWANLIIIDQLDDGQFIVRRKRQPFSRIHKQKPVLLTAKQIFNASRMLAFIEDLPKVPIRIACIGIHRALPADFMEVPFEKYLYCDNLYQGYLQTKSEDILTEMAQVLYDGRHVHPNTAQRVSVFYWFPALKAFFSRKFHHFLQPIATTTNTSNLLQSQTTAEKIEESMNAQIRALTKGVITKEKQILSLDTWRALTELDAKAHDAEEYRKITKSFCLFT